jgi:hypothetical protein
MARNLILETLVERNMFSDIGRILLDSTLSNPNDAPEYSAFMADMLMKPFQLDARHTLISKALELFAVTILTVPWFLDRFSSPVAHVLIQKLPFPAIMLKFASSSTAWISQMRHVRPASDMDGVVCFLANFLILARHRHQNIAAAFLVRFGLCVCVCSFQPKYIACLQALIDQLPLSVLDAWKIAEKNGIFTPHLVTHSGDDMDDDEMDVRSRALATDQRLNEAVAFLYDAKNLQLLAKALTLNPMETAKLIVTLSACLPPFKMPMMNVLMFSGDGSAYRALWQRVQSSSLYGKLQNKIVPATVFADMAATDDWCLLMLLADMLSRLLLTYSNDEFHDHNVFGVDNFITLSAILRVRSSRSTTINCQNALFALYTTIQTLPNDFLLVGSTVKLGELRDSMTRLLQQIYSREFVVYSLMLTHQYC